LLACSLFVVTVADLASPTAANASADSISKNVARNSPPNLSFRCRCIPPSVRVELRDSLESSNQVRSALNYSSRKMGKKGINGQRDFGKKDFTHF
jgi:hypothetical protein